MMKEKPSREVLAAQKAGRELREMEIEEVMADLAPYIATIAEQFSHIVDFGTNSDAIPSEETAA